MSIEECKRPYRIYQSIHYQTGPYKTIQNKTEPYRSIEDHTRPYRIILAHTELNKKIYDQP